MSRAFTKIKKIHLFNYRWITILLCCTSDPTRCAFRTDIKMRARAWTFVLLCAISISPRANFSKFKYGFFFIVLYIFFLIHPYIAYLRPFITPLVCYSADCLALLNTYSAHGTARRDEICKRIKRNCRRYNNTTRYREGTRS